MSAIQTSNISVNQTPKINRVTHEDITYIA